MCDVAGLPERERGERERERERERDRFSDGAVFLDCEMTFDASSAIRTDSHISGPQKPSNTLSQQQVVINSHNLLTNSVVSVHEKADVSDISAWQVYVLTASSASNVTVDTTDESVIVVSFSQFPNRLGFESFDRRHLRTGGMFPL